MLAQKLGGSPRRWEGNSPLLSAIVSSWNRTRFLPSALDSVVNQTLNHAKYQVILNSNLDSNTTARLTTGREIRVLYNDEEAQGRFYAKAIEAVDTDFVAFLDDDDCWDPSRLERGLAVLLSHPEIGLYHNERQMIDVAGSPIAHRPITDRVLRKTLRTPITVVPPFTWPNLRQAIRFGASFNLCSCIVRRSAILPHLDVLRRILHCEDTFMFYATICSGYGVFLDPAPLTQYRIHSGNLSRGSGQSRSRKLAWHTGAVQSLEAMSKMVKTNGVPEIRRSLAHDLAYARALRDLGALSESRRAIGQGAFSLLAHFDRYSGPADAGLLALASVRFVMPSVAWLIYSSVGT